MFATHSPPVAIFTILSFINYKFLKLLPADPLSALGLWQKSKAKKDLKIRIIGESLFHDRAGVAIFLTLLATALTGYALTNLIVVLWVLAIVIAGVMTGNRLSKPDIPERLKKDTSAFWKVLDEVLNILLFVLTSIEILWLDFRPIYIAIGTAMTIIVLIARFLSAGTANLLIRTKNKSWRPYVNCSGVLQCSSGIGDRQACIEVTVIKKLFS